MAAKKVVVDVTVVKVKPKYWQEYKKGIPSGAALWQRHGAKVLGVFLTEAGPSNEIIYVTEWATIDGRLNALAKIHTDPEYASMRDRQKFIYGKETYLCYARSKVPMKPFPANERVMLKKYNLHGNAYLCENKFIDMVCYRQSSDAAAAGKGPLAVLHPITSSNFGMLVFFAQPAGSIDAGQDAWYKFISEPRNWPKISEAYTKYSEKSGRVLKPFQA